MSSSSFESHDNLDSERRRFHRYQSEPVEIQVHAGSKTVKGRLVNESIGGMALFVQDASSFAVGEQIETNLHDATSTAYVRSVRRVHDGRYRVGISWEQQTGKNPNAAAHFLVYENLLLVCQVLCDQNGPARLVKLWDGAEFNVPSDTVRSRSFEQRRDDLNADPSQLSALAELYGLNPHSEPNQLVADILTFEFSSQLDTTRPSI
jgi:hypothetical protein